MFPKSEGDDLLIRTLEFSILNAFIYFPGQNLFFIRPHKPSDVVRISNLFALFIFFLKNVEH